MRLMKGEEKDDFIYYMLLVVNLFIIISLALNKRIFENQREREGAKVGIIGITNS